MTCPKGGNTNCEKGNLKFKQAEVPFQFSKKP